MSDPTAVPVARTAGRRTVRYASPAEVLADVARLRRGYAKVGQWSLPQACSHLAWVMTASLTPPPNDDEPTADQLATKAKFFGLVLSGMPEGMPLPQDKVPPATAGDADIDALTAAFAAVAAYPHARQMVGRCGPVPMAEVVELHLCHAAHHLSFLTPTTVRRTLRYASPAEVAADVRTLCDGYLRSGQWTLPQACWHLLATTRGMLARPMGELTADMAARRPTRDAVLAGGPLPDGLPLPPELAPPATADRADVDAFLDFLATFGPRPAMHRVFGPITAEQMGTLFLAHCGHHLSYLVPEPGGVTCPPAA